MVSADVNVVRVTHNARVCVGAMAAAACGVRPAGVPVMAATNAAPASQPVDRRTRRAAPVAGRATTGGVVCSMESASI
jgi:hypothetical protein